MDAWAVGHEISQYLICFALPAIFYGLVVIYQGLETPLGWKFFKIWICIMFLYFTAILLVSVVDPTANNTLTYWYVHYTEAVKLWLVGSTLLCFILIPFYKNLWIKRIAYAFLGLATVTVILDEGMKYLYTMLLTYQLFNA